MKKHMKKSIEKCPTCDFPLRITRYSCQHCGTSIEGSFCGCLFCRLSEEERFFAFIFLQTEGNLKDVERLLGISYPTVKARLAKVNSSLSSEETISQAVPVMSELPSEKKIQAIDQGDILDRLKSGEITAAQASMLLRGKIPNKDTQEKE